MKEKRVWDLKRQADAATQRMKEWPQWMRGLAYFAGCESRVAMDSNTNSDSVK